MTGLVRWSCISWREKIHHDGQHWTIAVPVLQLEPNLYPDNLLDEMNGKWAGRDWWVMYTKPRQAKALARDLCRRKIPFYLPLVRDNLTYGRRRVKSYSPLFGDYVFLFGSQEERVDSLATNRIARVLPVGDPQQFQCELRDLHELINSDMSLTLENRLPKGRRVRVSIGPLAGVEGTVLERRGGCRLVVSVDFLQRGASVEIDEFMLEPIY
jgi:transcriptional antiterminator RfaH